MYDSKSPLVMAAINCSVSLMISCLRPEEHKKQSRYNPIFSGITAMTVHGNITSALGKSSDVFYELVGRCIHAQNTSKIIREDTGNRGLLAMYDIKTRPLLYISENIFIAR